MFIITDYSEQIMREIDASSRIISIQPMNLAPPGGYIGQLYQWRVTFDATESTDPTIPASGMSLITNLNRIRAGVALGDGIIETRHLASGIIIPTVAEIAVGGPDNDPVYSGIQTIQFADSGFTLIDSHTILVDFIDTSLSGLMLTGSGFLSRSWFVEGTLTSGALNPDRLFNLPQGGITRDYISVSPSPGSSDAIYTIIYSLDGENWTDLKTVTHPSGTVYHAETSVDTLPSGALVGFRVDDAPTSTPFTDFTIILNTKELGTGGALPEFTPKRVPFADNDSGTLTESEKFNFLTANNSNFLVIGADTAISIAGSPDKVGMALVRDNADGGLILETYSDENYAPSIIGFRARGTRAVPDAVLQNDVLFRFTGRGYGATNWGAVPSFRLQGVANEDWTDTAYGTRAIIGVSPNGQQSTVDMLEIDGTGAVVYGDIEANATLIGTNLRITDGATTGYVLTATDGDGNAAWMPTTASGVAGSIYYNPDQSGTTSDYDDEFNDSTLDAKWTVSTYDSAFQLGQGEDGDLHLSESLRKGYVMFQGAWGIRDGFYQTFAPTDDEWTLVCKVSASPNFGQNDSFFSFGVGNSDNSRYYEARVGYFDGVGIRTVYNNGGGDTEGVNYLVPSTGFLYVIITKSYIDPDTFYSVFVSHDGFGWIPVDMDRNLNTLSTAQLAHQYFGTNNVGVDGIHSIDFVRYFNTSYVYQIGVNP